MNEIALPSGLSKFLWVFELLGPSLNLLEVLVHAFAEHLYLIFIIPKLLEVEVEEELLFFF